MMQGFVRCRQPIVGNRQRLCRLRLRPVLYGGRRCNGVRRRPGWTLVELMVAVTILTILLALLLPAVQSAREAARKTQCRNNLRQIAVAIHNFHSTWNQFPCNGWGYGWVGEPDRGTGVAQPGGWIYQLLPETDQANLRGLGGGLSPTQRPAALLELCRSAVPLFKCPSRPTLLLGPPSVRFRYWNADMPSEVARTDYAINEGDVITNTPIGPDSLAMGDRSDYDWTDVSMASGVSWLRGAARMSDVTDGTSNTYLCGEKYVSTTGYDNGTDRGYDQTLFSGVDLDINRWTLSPPAQDAASMADRTFGSAHGQACHMAFCDGSARSVSYAIDGAVHRLLGNRRDGAPASLP